MFQKIRPHYTRLFTRSLSLGLLTLWSDGESVDPRQWTTKAQPYLPYIIFVNKVGRQDGYYDLRGITWIQQEVRRKQRKEPKFLHHVATTFVKGIRLFRPVFLREPTLTLLELQRFTTQVRKIWPWFEALWWSIEWFEKTQQLHHSSLPLLQRARRIGERLVPGTDSVIRKSLMASYPRLGKLADYVLLSEAFQNTLPTADVLRKRRSFYAYINGTLIVNTTLTRLEKQYGVALSREKNEKTSIIRGTIAYSGLVQGRVRKVLNRDDVAVFRKGEVLIAPTTAPDFLPAIKKAVAIVSDEGGIICHAAIIARELKKPCLIGTKNAFDTLINGDLVVVDAKKGELRILKRISQEMCVFE